MHIDSIRYSHSDHGHEDSTINIVDVLLLLLLHIAYVRKWNLLELGLGLALGLGLELRLVVRDKTPL